MSDLEALVAVLEVQAAQATARVDQPREQQKEIAEVLAAAEREAGELETTRRVVARTAAQLPAEPLSDPPSAACQDILGVFDLHRRPLRAREIHEAPDLPVGASGLATTRTRLQRLAQRGVLTQPERGLYQQRTPRN